MSFLNKVVENIDWRNIAYLVTKSIIFTGFFAILHFIYYSAPNPFFQAIAGIDESVFQHWKLGYFSYLLLIGIEFIVKRKKIEDKKSFIFSRLLTSLLIPWMIFLIWYLAPAFIGAPLSTPWELTWSISVVFVIGILGGIIDQNTEKLNFSKSVKVIIIGLSLISILLFIWFSFITPWIDVFEVPHEH